MLGRWFGFGLMGLFVFWGMLAGGKMSVYIDIPSLILLAGIVVGGLLASFGAGPVVSACVAVFRMRDAEPMDPSAARHAAVFARGQQLAWGSGIVGTLVGLIAMFSDLSAPGSIGAGLALGLLSMLYAGLVGELIFAPLQQGFTRIAGEAMTGSAETKPNLGPAARGMAVTAMIIAMVATTFMTFI